MKQEGEEQIEPWRALTEQTIDKLKAGALSEVRVDPDVINLWPIYLTILKDKGATELLALRGHLDRRCSDHWAEIEHLEKMIERYQDDLSMGAFAEGMEPLRIKAYRRLNVFTQRRRIIDRILDLYALSGGEAELTPDMIVLTLPMNTEVRKVRLFQALYREGFGKPETGNKRFIWTKKELRMVVFLCKWLADVGLENLVLPSDASSYIADTFCWLDENKVEEFDKDSIEATWGTVTVKHATQLKQAGRRKRYNSLRDIVQELIKPFNTILNP